MDKIVFKFSKVGGEDVECRAFELLEKSPYAEYPEALKEIFLKQDYCLHEEFSPEVLEDYAKVLDEELPNILYEAGVVRCFSFFEFYDFDFARIYENILKCNLADEKILEALKAYEALMYRNEYYIALKAGDEEGYYTFYHGKYWDDWWILRRLNDWKMRDKMIFDFSKFGSQENTIAIPKLYYSYECESNREAFKTFFLHSSYFRKRGRDKAIDYLRVLDEELPDVLLGLGIVLKGFSFFDLCVHSGELYENILKYKIVDEASAYALKVYEDFLYYCKDYKYSDVEEDELREYAQRDLILLSKEELEERYVTIKI